MNQRITEFFKSFKGFQRTDILLGFLLIIIGFGSFALGRLSVLSTQKAEVRICTLEESALETKQSETPVSGVVLPPALKSGGERVRPAPVSDQGASVGAASTEGSYVASKSGKAYHLPWCSGAQRIKEENKIWFGSKAEAEAAGYQPAGNCKGL